MAKYMADMYGMLKVFRALSDETRFRILNLVLERECCVCEVVQAMGVSQSRASRGLAVLEDTGLLKARRDGLWVLYSIDGEGVIRLHPGLIELIRTAAEQSELVSLDRERLRSAVREGPCRERLRHLDL
jgi:ArsR family transcriptional regulator